MIKHTTTINEICRHDLGISRDEYALCQYAHYRAADPRQKKAGWCCDRKEDVADFIGITRPGIYKMLDKVSSLLLIEVDASTGYFRSTARFIDAENLAEKQKKTVNKVDTSKNERVNKVDTDCKQSLHRDVNKVTVNIEGIGGLNKIEKVECVSAHATEKQISTLEAEKEKKEPLVPGAPLFSHNHKPTDLNTHFDLFDQIGEYYKANPNEWKFRVREVLPKRYSDEQLKSMLVDYCADAFAERNKYATFAAHHAKFCAWVKRQPQYERKAQSQYTPTKKSHRPEINENYAPKEKQLW